MTFMKAVRIHAFGDPGVLTYEDAPRPRAGEDEVLIRIFATSVNPFDCVARAGYLTAYYPYTFPLILGLDVSGVVEEVGTAVTDFAPGDEVYARANPAINGAYAEYIAVAAAEVAAKPSNLDHYQAAALPHVGLTAWRALVEAARLSAGQTILIHGAAGGVGHVAVQLAKLHGATVLGTASEANLKFLRELGVDEAINYPSTPFEEVAQNVDVVLDTVGGDTLLRSWPVLKTGGLMLSITETPSQEQATTFGVRQQFVGGYPPAGGILSELAALVDAGQMKPVISAVAMLSDIYERFLAKRQCL
jgi:NADPH:quinone reductase-like Zn-dependent oxidoreductase